MLRVRKIIFAADEHLPQRRNIAFASSDMDGAELRHGDRHPGISAVSFEVAPNDDGAEKPHVTEVGFDLAQEARKG
jgi:hypothetical protein